MCHNYNPTSSRKTGHKSCHKKLPSSKIKMMLLSLNTLMVSITLLSAMLPLVFGDADSDAAASIMDGLLTGQNRAAKPEPFLDRIAALFGGGNKNQNKGKIFFGINSAYLIHFKRIH